MKLYYAPGGGMGHLSRGLAVAHTLGWSPDELLYVSASPYADKILGARAHQTIPSALSGNRLALQQWLRQLIVRENISEIYLDAFPVGMIGEWNAWPVEDIPLHWVCRRLNWENYAPLIEQCPHFAQCLEVEDLPLAQQTFVHQHSAHQRSLDLRYPDVPLTEAVATELRQLKAPLWLVVHSGPPDEVEALIDMARDHAHLQGGEPTLLVLSQVALNDTDIVQRSWGAAYRLFPLVERIFSGGGFNLMLQTLPYRHKHHYLPFVRRYDDQFGRCAQRRRE